jgi:hypothetical protein
VIAALRELMGLGPDDPAPVPPPVPEEPGDETATGASAMPRRPIARGTRGPCREDAPGGRRSLWAAALPGLVRRNRPGPAIVDGALARNAGHSIFSG